MHGRGKYLLASSMESLCPRTLAQPRAAEIVALLEDVFG